MTTAARVANDARALADLMRVMYGPKRMPDSARSIVRACDRMHDLIARGMEAGAPEEQRLPPWRELRLIIEYGDRALHAAWARSLDGRHEMARLLDRLKAAARRVETVKAMEQESPKLAGTVTGRLSSARPNFGNVPRPA